MVAYGNDDYSYIIGTVTNNSGRNTEFLKLVATLYDANGGFLGSEFTYSDLDVVAPGETTPFKFIMSDFAEFQTFELQAEASGTSEQPYRLEVKNLRLQGGSYPAISGQVTNTTGTELEFVKVVFTCYRDGKLADVEFTYADLDTLARGATSPFKSYFTSPYKQPQECEAVAQGQNY